MKKEDICLQVIPLELQDKDHKEATLKALVSDFYIHMTEALEAQDPGLYEFGLVIKKIIKES